MKNFMNLEMFYAAACLVYIISGLFCGYIRWTHMCRPFDECAHCYYPARKQITFFFSAVVLQFPYLLQPSDEGTWVYIRIFGVLYYSLGFSLVLRRYFYKQQIQHSILNVSGAIVVTGILFISLSLVLFGHGDMLVQYKTPLLWVTGGIGVLLTCNVLHMIKWLKKRINYFHYDNYSNEEDFPFKFAKKILFFPIIWIAMMFVVFFTANGWAKFIIDILCALWMVVFLSLILHPQLKEDTSNQDETLPNPEENSVNTDHAQETMMREEIGENDWILCDVAVRDKVLEVVLQKYKNPYLQKSGIMNEIPKGMKHDANKFISAIGFYNLINMFRLQYARLYLEAYPDATQNAVAVSSGFVSRYAFYRAKKQVDVIIPDFVREVSI